MFRDKDECHKAYPHLLSNNEGHEKKTIEYQVLLCQVWPRVHVSSLTPSFNIHIIDFFAMLSVADGNLF